MKRRTDWTMCISLAAGFFLGDWLLCPLCYDTSMVEGFFKGLIDGSVCLLVSLGLQLMWPTGPRR